MGRARDRGAQGAGEHLRRTTMRFSVRGRHAFGEAKRLGRFTVKDRPSVGAGTSAMDSRFRGNDGKWCPLCPPSFPLSSVIPANAGIHRCRSTTSVCKRGSANTRWFWKGSFEATMSLSDYLRDPDEIYRRSFAIARAETDLSRLPATPCTTSRFAWSMPAGLPKSHWISTGAAIPPLWGGRRWPAAARCSRIAAWSRKG